MRKQILLYIALFCCSLSTFAQVKQSRIKETDNLAKELEHVKAERFLLKEINVFGNKKTRASIILREMNIQAGDSIYRDEMEDMLELNRKRIFNLSIFIEVQIFTDSAGPGQISWNVHVKEQWYIIPEILFRLADRNFNVWWVEQNRDIRRANIGLTLKNRNFRGNLENASVTAQVGYTQKFGIEYTRPYVDNNQKHGFGVQMFYSQNEEWYYKTDSNKWKFYRKPGYYVTNSFQAAINYTLRPAYASRHLLELRYRQQAVIDTFIDLNPNYFNDGGTHQQLIEFLYRYDLNMVDNWNYPMTGLKAVVHSILRVGWKGFDLQNQYQLEAGYFKKLSNKFYSSHIFRGRLSFPEKQPYTFVYAMGTGSEYLRGYEYYVIDGSHYGLLRNNLKFELINKKLKNIPIKYIATIPIRIYPKIFTDVGYVRNRFPGNSYLNNRPLYSGGIGVDIVSIYDFKFRCEYTWNHLGEKGLFLHFTSE